MLRLRVLQTCLPESIFRRLKNSIKICTEMTHWNEHLDIKQRFQIKKKSLKRLFRILPNVFYFNNTRKNLIKPLITRSHIKSLVPS